MTDGMDMNLKYEYFSSVKQKKVEWLWYPYIPYGKITLLQGDPGEGKSTFILNVAALLTRGAPMPDGFQVARPQTVIYQCAEDNVADTVKPRLVAADADCEKVAYIVDDSGRLTLEDDRIEKAIIQTEAKLLILDPLQAFLSQDGDMQSAGRMRSILGKLSLLAAKYNCAIVLIGHMNKGNSGNSIYRSLGSIDIAAIARSVLMLRRDCMDSQVRYMTPIKSSLSPEGKTIAFSLGSADGFRWIGPCDIDDSDSECHHTQKNGKRSDVVDCLIEMLSGQDMLSSEVLAEMSQLGVSRRTAFNVKKEIGVQAYRKENAWYWRLPETLTGCRINLKQEISKKRNGGTDDEGR
jgi:hypothetical protein